LAEAEDVIDVQSWRHQATVGEALVYHTGYLASDRLRSAEVDRVASDAWSLAERGRVCLTQRKIEDGRYDYLAVASALRPWPVRD
jgi:hypothetical protein